MGNVTELFKENAVSEDGKFKCDYIFDGDKVVGVKHPDWNFRIQRNLLRNEIALVSEGNDEPFGIIDADVFNTILMCWLLVDDPKMVDDTARAVPDYKV